MNQIWNQDRNRLRESSIPKGRKTLTVSNLLVIVCGPSSLKWSNPWHMTSRISLTSDAGRSAGLDVWFASTGGDRRTFFRLHWVNIAGRDTGVDDWVDRTGWDNRWVRCLHGGNNAGRNTGLNIGPPLRISSSLSRVSFIAIDNREGNSNFDVEATSRGFIEEQKEEAKRSH